MIKNYCVVNKKVYQIVNRRGVKHFKGKLTKCGCKKVSFPHPDVAVLYSKYMFMKYGHHLERYWSDDCGCYHLTTAGYEVWERV